ncbi:hypothetical protein DX03_01855 [Stenotrophomonas rhizophila]|nr:hypothetical protein DX03_01855 [Stenotrophomonas rhizophila]
MDERRSSTNTMTLDRVNRLLQLVKDSNTGYFLVSGGGEGFLELSLMYRIIEGSSADVTWMVTSGFWATTESNTERVLSNCRAAHTGGNSNNPDRSIVIRLSVDQHHIDRIGSPDDPLAYVRRIIKSFDAAHPDESGFSLMLHCLDGEQELVDILAKQLGGSLHETEEKMHSKIKVTERSMQLLLPSGLELPVTFAKLLLSDMAADLRNEDLSTKRVKIWERDAYINEGDRTGLQLHDHGYGHDMLVIYDGRVAGGWQCEMPDVEINIDEHNYAEVMKRTLSDPGVLATIEKGLRYRFEVIEEVSVKACERAKAVNIRDYTSPVLLEEDRVKLYYTIRAIQDFRKDGRMEACAESVDSEVVTIINATRTQLLTWYGESTHDILEQYRQQHCGFSEFEKGLIAFSHEKNALKFVEATLDASKNSTRTVDQWRLLLLRVKHDWYDISSWKTETLSALDEATAIIDTHILKGKRPYEGLSMQSLR